MIRYEQFLCWSVIVSSIAFHLAWIVAICVIPPYYLYYTFVFKRRTTGPTQRHELVAIGDNGFGDYVRQNETEIQEDLDIARDANATSGIRKVNPHYADTRDTGVQTERSSETTSSIYVSSPRTNNLNTSPQLKKSGICRPAPIHGARNTTASISTTQAKMKRHQRQGTYIILQPVPLNTCNNVIPMDCNKNRIELSRLLKASEVLNDYLMKSAVSSMPLQLRNANNFVQHEWFKTSSTASANALDVKNYLDWFANMSSKLLEYVVNMVDTDQNTAMHYAVSHGKYDIVSILLDTKVCDVNRTNAAGYTCVMLVALSQVHSDTHQYVIQKLFQVADVNVSAKQNGQTALMLAACHGQLDLVQLLTENGADINIQDKGGSSALMYAAKHDHALIVKYLLSQHNCDASITDHNGNSALSIATEAGNRVINILLDDHD